MKNYYKLPVTALFAALPLPFAVSAQTATVYTPRGTGVQVNIYAEFTRDQINQGNYEAETQYPSAQRLTDASNRYNCHAYAWYLTEAPVNSTPYWMNDPNDDAYLTDGSYIQICNESEAPKVSYPRISASQGDHSAVRSVIAGKLDSKWGQYPVMRHAPGYAPASYNPSNRIFYAPTKIQASSTSICGNTDFSVATFTGGSYSWRTSSNVTLNTTTGPIVTATGNAGGAGWVEVTITSACASSTITSRVNVDVPSTVGGNYRYDTFFGPIQGTNFVRRNGNAVYVQLYLVEQI